MILRPGPFLCALHLRPISDFPFAAFLFNFFPPAASSFLLKTQRPNPWTWACATRAAPRYKAPRPQCGGPRSERPAPLHPKTSPEASFLPNTVVECRPKLSRGAIHGPNWLGFVRLRPTSAEASFRRCQSSKRLHQMDGLIDVQRLPPPFTDASKVKTFAMRVKKKKKVPSNRSWVKPWKIKDWILFKRSRAP